MTPTLIDLRKSAMISDRENGFASILKRIRAGLPVCLANLPALSKRYVPKKEPTIDDFDVCGQCPCCGEGTGYLTKDLLLERDAVAQPGVSSRFRTTRYQSALRCVVKPFLRYIDSGPGKL